MSGGAAGKTNSSRDQRQLATTVWRHVLVISLGLALGSAAPSIAAAQDTRSTAPRRAVVTGRVLDAESGQPVPAASVIVEGSETRGVASDSAGRYRIVDVSPGPQVLRIRRIGFAPARVAIVVPASGTLERELRIASAALRLKGVTVTADATSRARGELGTASVVDRDAIANQSAASLAGILELVPGIPLAPPGLDGTQQIGLRSVPTSSGSAGGGDPSAGDLASFGTLIVLDNVPLSNNANLQSTGPRGELGFPTSAGGGIDVRRIPASTLERVEVIRGLPSARYGDLTQGVIVIDTRAGAVTPEAQLRYDQTTAEASIVGGRTFGGGAGQRGLFGAPQAASATVDIARTRISPGIRDDDVVRLAAQLAHRAELGPRVDDSVADDGRSGGGGARAPRRFTFDTRVDFHQLVADNPERPEVQPGRANRSADYGLRLSERVRLAGGPDGQRRLELSAAFDHTAQRSSSQQLLVRGADPFTDRLTPGRAFGRYVGGEYLARAQLDGDPYLLYARLEGQAPATKLLRLDATHLLRAGIEARREWNAGPGYQFAIEFPPQAGFNGVNGYDRPRRYDAVPATATSSAYLDDRVTAALPFGMSLDAQAGLRIDALHDGTTWLSGARDLVLQPRLNVQIAPRPWLRLRGGAGRTAKSPSLAQLRPAPEFYDLVNVNYYANNPAERLAVLTTFVGDPTNPDLGYSVARKLEAGFEADAPEGWGTVGLTFFDDRITGAVGVRSGLGFLLRDRYDLANVNPGSGTPPTLVEPSTGADTIPISAAVPANSLTLRTRGAELTAVTAEVPGLRTRLQVNGAYVRTELTTADIDFGAPVRFSDFQLNPLRPRLPYYVGATRFGERGLITYRVVHQQPAVGLVITATVQQSLFESTRSIGESDSLDFAGYVTRGGELVPVPRERRLDAEFADVRIARSGLFRTPQSPAADWLASLQVAKTLPLGGRLSFYAFNAFDRVGRYAARNRAARFYAPIRFGLDVTMPVGGAR